MIDTSRRQNATTERASQRQMCATEFYSDARTARPPTRTSCERIPLTVTRTQSSRSGPRLTSGNCTHVTNLDIPSVVVGTSSMSPTARAVLTLTSGPTSVAPTGKPAPSSNASRISNANSRSATLSSTSQVWRARDPRFGTSEARHRGKCVSGIRPCASRDAWCRTVR